jgi:hypothetical protein
MATLTWNGSFGFDLADLDLSNLAYGIDYTQTSTRFTVEYNYSGSTRDEFRGYGLTYSRDGIPTGALSPATHPTSSEHSASSARTDSTTRPANCAMRSTEAAFS